MPITKQSVTILALNSVPAGLTKASPNESAVVNCSAYYGGELTFRILNGASAPTVPCTITFQVSHDGTKWFDYYTVAGDSTANSDSTGAIILDRGIMYLKLIAYGNTVNAVQVEAYLQAVTGV